MTTQERDNVIRDTFSELVAEPIGLNVKFPNSPFTEPADGLWARLTIVDGETTQQSIGMPTKRFRSVGVMIIEVMYPAGRGDKEAKDAAETIKSTFRCVSISGVVWRTPTTKAIGRDAKWWKINVTCPFYCDEVA